MWQPEPAWERLPGGLGASTGVWRTPDGHVVKRLSAPAAADPDELTDPHHPAYWRREADVALAGVVEATPGLRSAPVVRVDEDDDGVTLVHAEVAAAPPNGLFAARALGRFAAVPLDTAWLARSQLRSRLARTAARGGWTALARTPVVALVTALWTTRETWLARLDTLPQVTQHGDPVPANLRGVAGADVVALDWATLGRGPVGADLGYWSLSAREGFEPLVRAYADALPAGLATLDEVLLGARVTAAFTVLGRADWALAQAAPRAGSVEGAYRNPSVAPHLRALTDALDRIEPLLRRS